MTANAVEILIDVLTQQGITSLDELTKVLTSTITKTDALAVSVDDLDVTLTGLSKSGKSAEVMAAAMVTAMEEAGVQIKDVDGLAAVLTKTLKDLGVAVKEAATGVDLANKANEQLIGSADGAAGAVGRQAAGFKVATIEAGVYESALKGLQVGQASSAIAQASAVANLGAGYAKMTNLAQMATPALMKAATWAGLGLAGLAYEGIKQYTQFNKLITQTITQAGVAPSKFGFLSNLAESVAMKTGQGLTDVANTIYRAASGTASWNNGLGATKKQLSDIVTTVSKLNIVGGIAPGAESEQASRVVTALLNSNIRGVGHNSTSAAALVNAVIGSGDMRLADLVPGIGRGLLSSAVANNMTAQDAMAWVATLTSQGTTASVAGNYVKTGVNLLAHPSAQGTAALAMLGIKPGQLENLMSGPGGLVSALSTLKQGMQQLNPGNAGFFFDKIGHVRAGGSGMAGAIDKLQTWSANELNPKFIKDWMANKLTAKEQTQATDLILTKAFGGSKQFATIAAVVNKLGLVKGIEAHITAENTPGYFNAQYARTAATPAQQFKMMHQSLIVDLVKIGKELTPLGLTFGHVMTGTIGALSKFKGVIVGFALLAGGLLAAAGVSKVAQLGEHLSPVIGAAYTRLGHMAGVDSKFTTAMNAKANGGGFKFLDIYGTHKSKILSKLGGDSINAMKTDAEIAAGGTVAGLSKGESAIATAQSRGNVTLEKIAINTQVTADSLAGTGLAGGSGGLKSVEKKLGSIESKGGMLAIGPGTLAPGTRLSASHGGGVIPLTSSANPLSVGSIFMDTKSGRWTKRLSNGRTSFISKAEAMAAQERQASFGSYVPRDATYFKNPNLGGVDMGLGQYGPKLPAAGPTPFVTDAVMRDAGNIAGPLDKSAGLLSGIAGKLGGLAGGLGSLAGGPVGMMAMMAAPMILGLATPLLGKLGSLLGGWLGGGGQPAFHANIKNPLSVVAASAKVSKALSALRQFQTKTKSGKWVNNTAAILADQRGHDVALRNYQLASHTYTGSVAHAGTNTATALSDLYGPRGSVLSRELEAAKRLSGHSLTARGFNGVQGAGSEEQMRQLASRLPPGHLRDAILNKKTGLIAKHGANWQDFSKLIQAQKTSDKGYMTDTLGSSAQWLDKHSPLAAALVAGRYFTTGDNLSRNTSQMNSFLRNKHVTVAEAARDLPLRAHQYSLQVATDNRAILANKNFPDARKYFQDQKAQAEAALHKTDAIIRELRTAAKDTHLAGESAAKIGAETANRISANGLTADKIGAAVAKAMSPYMKTSPVGTGGGTTGRKGAPRPATVGGGS